MILYFLQEQILNFISLFSFNSELYYKLESLIVNDHSTNYPKHSLSVKTFTSTCQSNLFYNAHIASFKTELLNIVSSITDYSNIKNRISIHYKHLETPKETMWNKFVRYMFTHKPSPYHYDFCNSEPTEDDFSELINKIKSRFGYSSRKTLSPASKSFEINL